MAAQFGIVGSWEAHGLIVARPALGSPGLRASLILPCRAVRWLGEQAADAVCGALVAFDLTLPAAFPGIVGELPLKARALAEPRRVLGKW
jgi:hypothetical protein